MSPVFSVVIPAFRRPRQLAAALDSICAQTGVSFEVIVVDDSPERSSREVVENRADPRLCYVANPTPSGGVPSRVRNFGLRKCSGEFVHFLDDDDIVPSGHYQRVREEFRANPHIGMVFGRIEPFGDAPAEQLEHEKAFFAEAVRRARMCARLGSVYPYVGQMLFGQVLLVCSSAVLRRKCADAVSGFDPEIVLQEDRDFFVRVMRNHGVRFIDRVSLHYRVNYPSLMHAPNPSLEQLALERMGKELLKKKYLASHGPIEYYGLNIATKLLNKAT